MRARVGWATSILGVLAALAGAALMIVLGPDSRLSTGPHAIETDGVAVVTTPQTITWANVRVDVLAEVPARKPIFVGVANSVDVADYAAKSQRLEITSFQRPWRIDSRQVGGTSSLPGAPTALDWWLESSAGLGGASISVDLPDETVSLAIMSVGSSNLSGLTVTVAYGVAGGFAKGIALLLLGFAVIWLGILVRRPTWDGAWADDEQHGHLIRYVYIDDDGVEHELTAQEAAGMDVIDEVVEDVEEGESDDEVQYVFIDDDGVEHIVSAEDLDDFVVVDEEEQR